MSSRGPGDWRRRFLGARRESAPAARLEFVRDPESPIISRRSRTLHRSETVHRFTIKHNLAMCTSPLDVEMDVDNFYRELLDEALAGASPRDIYSVYINSESLIRPIFLHPARVESRDIDAFCNALYEVSQSNSSFLTHGQLEVQVNIVQSVRGGGRTRKASESLDSKRAKMGRSLILIDPTIGFCFLRSLALCIYRKENRPIDMKHQ